ncbi:MAG: aminodeoxychorismate lyase [Pseudomonadota bacterium]
MTTNVTRPVLLNGEPMDCVSSMDRGLLYGDGVFETITVQQGRPRCWRRHMTRLQAGCQRLGITAPDIDILQSEASVLLAGVEQAVLKLIITRGTGGRGYRVTGKEHPTRIMQLHPLPDMPESHGKAGITVRLCSNRLSQNPALAGIKHLNRLEQVLARCEWDDPDIHEGLLCDTDGNLIEGTMSNLFLVTNGVIHTPDLSRCGVAGIMRTIVMEMAEQQGIPLKITILPLAMLEQADEVFVTNSLIGIWPVSRIDAMTFIKGPVTTALQTALEQVQDEGEAWRSETTANTRDA